MFDLGNELKRMAQDPIIDFIKKQRRVLIADTTLRDGEQTPRASLNADQKLTIARQLDALGVDSIEAGFPASSKEDFESVKLIASKVKRPVISALSRCNNKDIELTVKALKNAKQWSITLFLGTSPMLRRYSLNKKEDEVIDILKSAITFAKKWNDRVTFGAEDASRTEPEFLYRVYEEAIDAGAVVVGFSDTVGWLVPEQVKEMIEEVQRNVPNIGKALLGIHFHNDLGLAVANSLAAIECGANIVQCTVNGLGERAGNASLEELVMALKMRKDHYKVTVGVNTKELFKTSNLVAELTGINISPTKPIVGNNVFATEAGIHQAALLKNRLTYEIIKPEEVGQRGTTFVLGRHSGRHAIYDRLKKLGYKIDGKENEESLNSIYERFKGLASTKKEVSEEELSGLAKQVLGNRKTRKN